MAENEGRCRGSDTKGAVSNGHSPWQACDGVRGGCLTYLQEEPDQVSRELRAEAARAAVRLDDELVEQLEAAQGQ